MKPDICHVITTIDFGGAEKQLLQLAACQVQNGHKVEVIFLKGDPQLHSVFTEAGVLVNQDYSHISFFRQIFHLSKRRNESNKTLFHAHLPRSELLCALSLRRNTFIVSRHNAEHFFSGAHKWLSRLLSRFVIKRSFAVILISNAVRTFLLSAGEICRKDYSRVIYYGVSIKTSINNNIDSSSRINDTSRYNLGTISRLVPQKNIEFLLQIGRQLQMKYRHDFRINIMGTGYLKKDLQDSSSKLGIDHLVNWYEPTEDVDEFYQAQEVFILTSDYEGFGLVLLEAMQNSIPIVARNSSAIPEVLGEDHPGLMASLSALEWAETIFRVINIPQFRAQIIDFQHQRLKSFSISQTYLQHLEIYLACLEETKL